MSAQLNDLPRFRPMVAGDLAAVTESVTATLGDVDVIEEPSDVATRVSTRARRIPARYATGAAAQEAS